MSTHDYEVEGWPDLKDQDELRRKVKAAIQEGASSFLGVKMTRANLDHIKKVVSGVLNEVAPGGADAFSIAVVPGLDPRSMDVQIIRRMK